MKRICVACDKAIDEDNETYIVGESLGEYWCLPCAEEDRKE